MSESTTPNFFLKNICTSYIVKYLKSLKDVSMQTLIG